MSGAETPFSGHELRKEVASYDLAAQAGLAGALSCRPGAPERKEFIRRYILGKLMVDEGEATDSLDDMLEMSVEKTLGMSKDEFRALEAATTCKGAKTSSVKKALLFRAIEKDFDMTFPRYSTGSIKTMERLCALVDELQGMGVFVDQFDEAAYILR